MGFQCFVCFGKMMAGKSAIFFLVDRAKVHHRGALVERMRRAGEDVAHQMTLAAREDELGSVALLNVCAQQGLHVLFGEFSNLLEFIDSDDIRSVGMLKIVEDFLQRDLWLANVTQLYVKFRKPGQVGSHHKRHRSDCRTELLKPHNALRCKGIHDGAAHHIYHLAQRAHRIEINEKQVIVLF